MAGVLGSDYEYRWEDTFRPTMARSRTDATLDRWYNYDNVGRLHIGRSGSEARAAYGEPFNGQYDGPYSMGVYYDVWGNITLKEGWGGTNPAYTAAYTNNKRNGLSYDAAGNVTNDGSQTYTYDATGQQAYASATALTQSYDGDRLRGKKVESGVATYYLRSSVLGGQVIAEINSSSAFTRGYVYLGSQLLAVQQNSAVSWVHQDPVTKSQRITDSAGTIVSRIELDPWGGETSRSSEEAFQPKKYTSYVRDANGSDDAMHRRYSRWHSRFDQPDPYDGSYNLGDPQSFNRYTYTQNDPVNFVDPSGLRWITPQTCSSVPGVEGRGITCTLGDPFWVPNSPPANRNDLDRPARGGNPGQPQNPAPTEAQRKCDQRLASIFGDEGSVAAGSGFEPPNMPGKENQFRGGPNGHLNNAMHLYGSGDGYGEGGVYIPAGGRYIGKNPYSSEDSYMFYYSRLGNARNVTLFTAHVDNFSAPRGTTTGRTRIGDIGGEGGRSSFNPNSPFNQGPYIHAHLAIHQGRGYTGKRLFVLQYFLQVRRLLR